ncbi:unnamed protein product [Pedinophyceae sp. YPF-701]|nr:unnamed protein product [Pedinophyceae sp. YPF-701]
MSQQGNVRKGWRATKQVRPQGKPWTPFEDIVLIEWYHVTSEDGVSADEALVAAWYEKIADTFHEKVAEMAREANEPPPPRRSVAEIRAKSVELGLANDLSHRTDAECFKRLVELGVIPRHRCPSTRAKPAARSGTARRR